MMSQLHSAYPGNLRHSPNGYQYYMPGDIFLSKNLDFPIDVIKKMEKASLMLGQFSYQIEQIANPLALVYSFSMQEARFSSRIEGTQTEIDDAFMIQDDVPAERRDDWAELNAYIRALQQAVEAGKKLPLCNRLLKETHATLLSQVRGKDKLPGEFRRTQNWLGGSRPDNAHFVPPEHQFIDEGMSNLERFIQDTTIDMPDLIKAALIHAQFETIHPFLDGNGRMGRILISLYLLEREVLRQPILYISSFFEKNRQFYYEMLDGTRKDAAGVIKWISFFLQAVCATAENGIAVTQSISELSKSFA